MMIKNIAIIDGDAENSEYGKITREYDAPSTIPIESAKGKTTTI